MNFSWVIPSKLAGSQGPLIDQDIAYLREMGVGAIVRLAKDTISGTGAGLADLAEFVPDFEPPTARQIDRIVAFISEQIEKDVPVVVACKAGLGRTGTVLACYLVHTGYTARDALEHVRRLRPGSADSPLQEEFVYMYEMKLKGHAGRTHAA